MQHKRTRDSKHASKKSIAPPIHPRHRSLANEEAEAINRFFGSQRLVSERKSNPEVLHLYDWRESPREMMEGQDEREMEEEERIERAESLLKLLTQPRKTDFEVVEVTKTSISAPMRRFDSRAVPEWRDDIPDHFGPRPQSKDCGYFGKEYKVLNLKEALEILALKTLL